MNNPRLRFLPLLILYIIIIAAFSGEDLVADEIRYNLYAERLTEGKYVGDPADPDLINGPGLPILMLPFVALKIPIFWIRFLNAIFLYGSAVYMFKFLVNFTTERKALIWTYLAGLYPVFLVKGILHLWPEMFCTWLLMGFTYFMFRASSEEQKKWLHIGIAGFMLGFATLTKFVYGYVILVGLVLSVGHFLLTKDKRSMVTTWVLAAGFALCIPYLAYTYSLTGRPMYWGNNGGTQLYWMSAPYEEEWGNWFSIVAVNNREIPVHQGHRDFLKDFESLTFTERDDLFAERGKENISNYPEAYLKNWVANIGRMLFNYPHSYRYQSLTTYLVLGSNMLPVLLGLFSLIPAWINRRRLSYFMISMVLFHLIYCGGLSLVATISRYFTTVIPFILVWLAYIEHNFVIIKFKKEDETNL